jgi:hypothetical protein
VKGADLVLGRVWGGAAKCHGEAMALELEAKGGEWTVSTEKL